MSYPRKSALMNDYKSDTKTGTKFYLTTYLTDEGAQLAIYSGSANIILQTNRTQLKSLYEMLGEAIDDLDAPIQPSFAQQTKDLYDQEKLNSIYDVDPNVKEDFEGETHITTFSDGSKFYHRPDGKTWVS